MWCKLISTILVAVITQHVIRFLLIVHTFQNVFNHAPGPCKQLPSVVNGSEKGFLLPNGLLYITSGFGRVSGKLLKYDFDSNLGDTEEFVIDGNFDSKSFSTHGLGGWVDPKSGEVTLFAVNHHSSGERVEVFKHDGTKTSRTLKHVKTITDPKITFLNDIVATGPDSFYATIFCKYEMTIEFLLLLSGGGLLHYDKGKTTVLETGIKMANGINLSPDKKYLYVVQGIGGTIISYKVEDEHSVERIQVFATNSGPDNIHVDPETGDLWVASHPNGYTTAWHLSFPDQPTLAYSQVLRIKAKNGILSDVTEVYANDGEAIRASSTAITYKNKLFIGSVMDKALVCDMKYVG